MSSVSAKDTFRPTFANTPINTSYTNCEQNYAIPDSVEHSARLSQQMEKVYLYYHQIRQLLADETTNFSNNLLMKKIDEWEQQSIRKVQTTANEIRQQLKHAFNEHTIKMSEVLRDISQQLNAVRMQNNHIEADVKFWLDKLHEFKTDFQTPKTLNVIQDELQHSFICKIKLSKISLDRFHHACGDIHIMDDGFALVHGPSIGDSTVRGKQEYFSGTHRFRFRIEKLGIPRWVFFGITSKSASSQASLHKTATLHGWAGHHQVWLNGIHHHQYNGYVCEFDMNHVIQLLIDCDKQMIQFTDEAIGFTHEISVPTAHCPFPWILHLGLYGPGDQVRLLFA